MTFAILEGWRDLGGGVVKIIQPGMKTGIPFGGADGLQGSGAPSDPAPYDSTLIQNVPLDLLDRQSRRPTSAWWSAAADRHHCHPDAGNGLHAAHRLEVGYVIQVSDNLASIALKLNMRTADLQAGNCIADPNRLIAGQSITYRAR